MFRQVLRPRCFKVLLTALKHCIPNVRVQNLTQLGVGVVYAKSIDIPSFDNVEHEQDLKRATKEGEKYLSQLICMLRTLILETSIEYQECLIKQIELTKENTKIGPIGQHWDKLTNIRVKGNELKEDLYKYQALAKNIGDLAIDQSSSDERSEVTLDKLNEELEKLKKLCDMQLKEINKYEKELLEANCDSILYEKPK